MSFITNKTELENKGFSTTPQLYSTRELNLIKELIDKNASFSKVELVYSIRKLLIAIPELSSVLFNKKLVQLIDELGGRDFFLTKSIYFDKPEGSNWFVSYHQDLSISVSDKTDIKGYKNWTVKKDQFGVQPPIEVLEKTITIRIHLDDTDQNNGALRVIPASHKKGIARFQKDWINENGETICNVQKGAAMLMKPLTFHASKRSQSGIRRRVIHLEFCNQELESPLKWSEKLVWTSG